MSPTFDFLSITGLKKKPPKSDPKYASFHRRMLAATVDSFLLMILIAPLIEWSLDAIFGPIPFDLPQFQATMQTLANEQSPMQFFTQYSAGAAVFYRWLLNVLLQTVALLVGAGYCWHFWGATPGKMLFRCKVVDMASGGAPSTRQILLRLLGYVVASLPLFLGIFWIGIDKRKQGWHDKMAGTAVVVIPWKKSKSDSATADR